MQFIIDNKEWIFSGIGVTFISFIIWLLRRSKNEQKESPKDSQVIKGLKVNGNVKINQNINKTTEHKTVPNQILITFMALKQMPARIQEAANLGMTSFCFDEARHELEKLYVLAKSENNPSLVKSIEQFQYNYNEYIVLINKVIRKEATLDEVDNFHSENIIAEYENNIRLPNQ